MLTLERCRQILGDDAPQSNSDLERMRDQLYGLARVVVEACPRQRRGNGLRNAPAGARRTIDSAAVDKARAKPAAFPDALAMLPEDERYEVEERAAIMEFDGGLDRDAAERAAFSQYWRAKHRGN
jgi:hypothetical protein